MFFLLPSESLEKKKRWLKERRKIILEEANILNPSRNNFDFSAAGKKTGYGNTGRLGDEEGVRKLKYGVGKRMNLAEMLMLYKHTKQSTIS